MPSNVPVILVCDHVKELAQTLPEIFLWDIGEDCFLDSREQWSLVSVSRQFKCSADYL